MKRNKKGFTLIELLTVIAILAVILLIAAPVILGVLDKARKNTFKNQVLLYVEGLKTQTALAAMGSGYAQLPATFKAPTSDSANATSTVTVADMNTYVMDNGQLTGGTLTVEYTANGYNYYISSMTKTGEYITYNTCPTGSASDCTDATNVNVKDFTIDNIKRADQ